jgi:hypothetical protein
MLEADGNRHRNRVAESHGGSCRHPESAHRYVSPTSAESVTFSFSELEAPTWYSFFGAVAQRLTHVAFPIQSAVLSTTERLARSVQVGALAVSIFAASVRLHSQVVVPSALVVQVRQFDGGPVSLADVALHAGQGMVERRAVTDSSGHVSFSDPGGSGEYIISVSAAGFRFVRRRVENTMGLRTLIARFSLVADSAPALLRVVVRANRPAVERRFIYDIPPGNVESAVQGADAVAPPAVSSFSELLRNNLLFDGGGSAGATGGESQTQLNGLLFVGSSLPRSAPVVVRGTVAEYDASVAGFSASRIAADISAAGEYVERTGMVSVVTAPSSTPDGVRRRQLLTGSALVDLGGTTLLRRERVGLSWGVRGQFASDVNAFLEIADTSFLAARGLSPTKVAAIQQTGRARGLIIDANVPASNFQAVGSAIARVDFARRAKRTNALVGTVNADRQKPFANDAFSAQGLARETMLGQVSLQHIWEEVDRHEAIWRARTSATFGSQSSGPVVDASRVATVRLVPVADSLDYSGAPVLTFGGGAPPALRTRVVFEEQIEREQRMGTSASHQVKLFAQARMHAARENETGTAARIEFPTLLAFNNANNAGVSVNSVPSATANALRLSAGVNDSWRISTRLRSSGGVRADYQRLSAASTGSVSTVFDVSPRLGLTWTFAQPKEGPGYLTTNLLRRQLVPSGVLRLGAGVFGSDYAPDDALTPGRVAPEANEIVCRLAAGTMGLGAGTAADLTPARLATACLGQTGALERTSRGMLGRTFAPSRSFRATGGIVTQFRLVDISFDAVVSRTLRQERFSDVAVPLMAVDSVGAIPRRAFFGALDSVEASSGQLRAGRSAAGANVLRSLLVTSDLATTAQRYVITMQSKNGFFRWPFKIGYAWSRIASERDGFSDDTFGSPWSVERATSPQQRRHQVQFELAHTFRPGIDVSLWSRIASGARYTPLIQGDVNGDGRYGNDRFGLVDLPDVQGRSSVDALSSALSSGARRCLQTLTAVPVSRTCAGPWTVTSSLVAKIELGDRNRFPRAQLSVAIENPFSVFGGALRAAAAAPVIDPYVAQVRSFDAATRRFRLASNPNFGRRITLGRPFSGAARLSVSLQIPLAPSIRSQQVDRWFIRRGYGSELSMDSLTVLFARGVPNVLQSVLAQDDELALSVRQREQLQSMRDSLARDLRTIWSRFASEIQRAQARLSRDELTKRVEAAHDAAWERSRVEANQLLSVLSPLQQTMIASNVSYLMRATRPVHLRVIYY